jgi:DNA-binding transcriptional LysR family regulator
VVLSVPYYGAIFPVVAATDCIAPVSRRQAEHFAKSLPLRILPLLVKMPTLRVSLNRHTRVDADASATVLRRLIRESFAR